MSTDSGAVGLMLRYLAVGPHAALWEPPQRCSSSVAMMHLRKGHHNDANASFYVL